MLQREVCSGRLSAKENVQHDREAAGATLSWAAKLLYTPVDNERRGGSFSMASLAQEFQQAPRSGLSVLVHRLR